jgi:hypothetical protein
MPLWQKYEIAKRTQFSLQVSTNQNDTPNSNFLIKPIQTNSRLTAFHVGSQPQYRLGQAKSAYVRRKNKKYGIIYLPNSNVIGWFGMPAKRGYERRIIGGVLCGLGDS